jgi:hypothetical protein
MARPFTVIAIAGVAAIGVAACTTAASSGGGRSIKVSIAPDRAHKGRWCATAVDGRQPDGRLSLCQSQRERARTEAVLQIDCPTHRVVFLGLAPRQLDAAKLTKNGDSESATLARSAHVTAFAVAAALGDFPARLRTSAGSRVGTRLLRDPHSLCRTHPRVTSVVDAFDAS